MGLFGHPRWQAGVVDAKLRVFNGQRRLICATKHLSRTRRILINEIADHVEHVFLRSAEPVLQG